MTIILQSTVVGFSAEFMRRLPELEQEMVAHGLKPSQFVISKDRATPATVPGIGPFLYDYTVLPYGIVPRFITKTYRLSEGRSRWRLMRSNRTSGER